MPVFQLTDDIVFPKPSLAEENGLLAIGGDLSPGRLITGYRHGIFPWYSEGDPILWWFTSPRLVIYPNEFRIPKRLVRYMRKPLYRVTMDKAFDQVIESCAGLRTKNGEETWITDEMRNAYCQLHDLGYAHSVECWQNETLAGGLYGIALDRVFFGESMFTSLSNGSKIALASLVNHLKKRGFGLIDCQMTTDHLLRYGAREISGRNFLRHLKDLISTISPDGVWTYDTKN
jgi:leucyl/phenylalanyl-tRNA--protein transferase